MALLPCQRRPHRRVRTDLHFLRLTLHYGNYHLIGATSDDGQMTAVLFDLSLNDVLIEEMNPLLR